MHPVYHVHTVPGGDHFCGECVADLGIADAKPEASGKAYASFPDTLDSSTTCAECHSALPVELADHVVAELANGTPITLGVIGCLPDHQRLLVIPVEAFGCLGCGFLNLHAGPCLGCDRDVPAHP